MYKTNEKDIELMRYINLPEEVIEEIQDHYIGGYLYYENLLRSLDVENEKKGV